MNLEYKGIRWVFEESPLAPKVDLYEVEGATFEAAREADHKNRDFSQSARLYYSILRSSQDSNDRVGAFGGLVLQLTNAKAFRQAREQLRVQRPQLLAILPREERYFLEADVKEKEGRIEVSERGYFPAIECFSGVRERMQEKGKERWTLEEQKTVSTAEHFLGKIRNVLASRGIKKNENILVGRMHLLTAVSMDAVIRGAGTEETLGYDKLEIAKGYLIADEIAEADKFAEEARKHFETYVQTTPKSNVLEGYRVLREKIDSSKAKS